MSKKPNNLSLLPHSSTQRELHSYNTTLSFLDQSITSTIDTQAKETRLTHHATQKEILLSYNIEKRRQSIVYPNGTKEQYYFNKAGELEALKSATMVYGYQRDALGRITKLNDKLYEYDAIGRLTRAGITLFEYDKAGNNLHNNSTYHRGIGVR